MVSGYRATGQFPGVIKDVCTNPYDIMLRKKFTHRIILNVSKPRISHMERSGKKID